MIKTLRITSFLAAIAAVALWIVPVFFGFRTDEQTEEFLRAPSVLEQFKESRAERARRSDQKSPLVEQAKLFALYLNPPPPPPPPPPEGGQNKDPVKGPVAPPAPRPPSSVRFEVHGVSYYPARPEKSIAWIVAKNKEQMWLRQGEVYEHWTIADIKQDTVKVQSGDRTFDLDVQRPPETSLLDTGDSEPDEGINTRPVVSTVAGQPAAGAGEGARVVSAGKTSKPTIRPVPKQSPEQAMNSVRALLESMSGGGKSNGDGAAGGLDTNSDLMKAVMKGLEGAHGAGKSNKIDTEAPDTAEPVDEASGRLNGEESRKLNDMGRELDREDQSKAAPNADTARKDYRDRRVRRLSRDTAEERRRRAQERTNPQP